MHLIKISPSNILQKMLLFEKYYQNCQACFGRSKCEWVNIHHFVLPVCVYKLEKSVICLESKFPSLKNILYRAEIVDHH